MTLSREEIERLLADGARVRRDVEKLVAPMKRSAVAAEFAHSMLAEFEGRITRGGYLSDADVLALIGIARAALPPDCPTESQDRPPKESP